MGKMDGPSESFDQPRRCLHRLGFAVDPGGQASPLNELQGEVWPAFRFANVVNLHDIGVLQAGDGFTLSAEAGLIFIPVIEASSKHLQGYQSVEPDLAGLIDHPHATAA